MTGLGERSSGIGFAVGALVAVVIGEAIREHDEKASSGPSSAVER